MSGRLWLRLSEEQVADKAEVGGKGWGLSLLQRSGLPIPRTAVLTTHAFERVLESIPDGRAMVEAWSIAIHDDLAICDPSHDRFTAPSAALRHCPIPRDVRDAVEAALEWVAEGQHPEDVRFAIRSSALGEDEQDASFAGIYESFLSYSKDRIDEALHACWACALSPRAATYRRFHRIVHVPVSMALVIQPMVPMDCGGVLFSKHPVTGQRQWVLNRVRGSGEAVVGGTTDATTVIIPDDDPMLLPPDPVLSEAQMRTLLDASRHLVPFFGDAGVDVEWGFVGAQVVFFQARPMSRTAEVGLHQPWGWSDWPVAPWPDRGRPQRSYEWDSVAQVFLATPSRKRRGSAHRSQADFGGVTFAPDSRDERWRAEQQLWDLWLDTASTADVPIWSVPRGWLLLEDNPDEFPPAAEASARKRQALVQALHVHFPHRAMGLFSPTGPASRHDPPDVEWWKDTRTEAHLLRDTALVHLLRELPSTSCRRPATTGPAPPLAPVRATDRVDTLTLEATVLIGAEVSGAVATNPMPSGVPFVHLCEHPVPAEVFLHEEGCRGLVVFGGSPFSSANILASAFGWTVAVLPSEALPAYFRPWRYAHIDPASGTVTLFPPLPPRGTVASSA